MKTSTFYKILSYDSTITPVQVISSSERTVTLVPCDGYPQRRQNRVSQYDCYFPSWEEAHQYLTKKATDRLDNARIELQDAQDNAENVKGMKQPR